MSDRESLLQRIDLLERRVRRLAILAGVLSAVALIAAARPHSEVLRARGLIITDASGRERIILGAPMREASADGKLAQTVGLAVLDSLGRMQVSVGSNNPLVLRQRANGDTNR
jgi:hypothetical protein